MRFSILAVSAFLATFVFSPFASADYGIYYGTNQAYANKMTVMKPLIVQSYNFALFAKYSGPKICYLSVGEFDGTATELAALGLSGSVVGFNSQWNSHIMDMASPDWQKYLVAESVKLKKMGCSGLFLDTVWQDGQEAGGIAIVKKLRANWTTANIVVNNAHSIKNEVRDSIDGYMFENFWDRGTTAKSADGKWLLVQMAEYAQLKKNYGKSLYALDYGNPFQYAAWAKTVKGYANTYGFDLVFANANLTTTFGYLDSKTNAIVKP